MFWNKLIPFLLTIIFLISLQACTRKDEKKEPAVFKQQTDILEARPQQKPVNIKLKRSANGEYSWDLSGSDADEVLKVDKRLKESLK
ncbi:MAG: hypothetical protein HZC48_09955 [Nitrospirae bacterium]|nr:hypothetical protein [Nitrospirota bacterium]